MSVTFTSHLKVALDASHEALMRAAEIIGGMAESHAKQALTDQKAVDTGLLRNSVTHGIAGESPASTHYESDDGSVSGDYKGKIPKTGNNVTVVVGTNVFYGPFIELGTGRNYKGSGGHGVLNGIRPRPYIRPSIEEHIDEYKEVVETELRGD